MEAVKDLFGQNENLFTESRKPPGISCHLMASWVYDTCCGRMSTPPPLRSWGRSLCSKQVPSTLPWFAQQPLFLPWVAEHGALLHSPTPGCLLHSYIWHSLEFTLRAAQKQPRMMGTSPRADNMTAVELIYVHLRKNEQTIVGMLLNKSSSFWMYKTFCTSEPE